MPGSMTQVSRFEARRSWTILDLPAVARLSLYGMVSMLFGVPTCLVTNTTEFPQPVPSAPFVNPNNALATVGVKAGVPPTNMVFIDPGPDPVTPASFKTLTLAATVQSEDNGRTLFARAIGDYKVGDTVVGGGVTLEPSTFDDVRTITATLTPKQLRDLGLGCHQVALVVTHEFDSVILSQPRLPSDTTFVVWWVLIEHSPVTLAAKCPPGQPEPTDAGIDAEAGP
jgi:hypothetical protein